MKAIATTYEVEILDRPEQLATDTATLDEVMDWVIDELGEDNGYLMVQPTMPEVKADDLERFMSAADDLDAFSIVVMTVDDSHLYWQGHKLLSPRRNRQQQEGLIEQEIGVRFYMPTNSLYEPWGSWHLDRDVIDIDSWGDLSGVRHRYDRQTVVFNYIENKEVGSGHRTRCEALMSQLGHHRLLTYHASMFPSGGRFNNYVVINDTLDTTEEHMLAMKAIGPVVTLEDHGPGARHADVIVNALYGLAGEMTVTGSGPTFSGPDYAVLRPEFMAVPSLERTDKVLMTFGGTDPSGLTTRFSGLAKYPGEIIISPPGWTNHPRSTNSMAYELATSMFVVTSCGRTLYEAAAVGTPAIAIAANPRETTHAHLGPAHGNIYLGLHGEVRYKEYAELYHRMVNDEHFRQQLADECKVDGKGAQRIARLVEGLML